MQENGYECVWAKTTPIRGKIATYPRTGVTKNGPALEPVTEDSPALEVTAGGAPLTSIKEFPEEEPAPAASRILRRASADPTP